MMREFRDPYGRFKLIHHVDRIRQVRDGLFVSKLVPSCHY